MSSSLYGGRGSSPAGQMSSNTSTGNFGGSMREKIPKGFSAGSLRQFTPEQMQLFKQQFGNLDQNSFLSRLAGGQEGAFDEMEAPALRQFNELQGNMASRFSGMGSGGARRSSGFQNAMGQESSNFAQQLQSQRMGLQRTALNDLMSLSGQLLNQRPYERTLTEKPKSFLHTAGTALAGGIGSGIGAYLGGKF
jgi:hypothetical protein